MKETYSWDNGDREKGQKNTQKISRFIIWDLTAIEWIKTVDVLTLDFLLDMVNLIYAFILYLFRHQQRNKAT